MILVIKGGKVVATHSASQRAEITRRRYPDADKIVEIAEGIVSQSGDDDPTIATPGCVASYLYAPIQVTYTTPETMQTMAAGKLTTIIQRGQVL